MVNIIMYQISSYTITIIYLPFIYLFFPTPLPRQCKGGLPVHRSGMPLSASEGPGSLKILLSPNLPTGNSPLDRGTDPGGQR